MKSILIKDTTKQERIQIIKESMSYDVGCDDCGIDLMDMYSEYINGNKEISQINSEFSAGYVS